MCLLALYHSCLSVFHVLSSELSVLCSLLWPEYYIKTMEKLLDAGDGYTEPEITRIRKLTEAKVSYGRKQDFKARINILKTFALDDSANEL